MPVRQVDLAQKLGISQGTVSRALRGEAGISGEIRERILAAAQEEGYELPDSRSFAGQPLVQRRTGVICADVSRESEWHERLLDGIIQAGRQLGQEIIISAHARGTLPQVVARGHVDGLIRLMCQEDYRKREVAEAPVPTVSVLYPVPGADVVSVDHFGSAYALGRHLGELKPGLTAYVGHNEAIGRARFAGVRCALEDAGNALPAELVRVSDRLDAEHVMPLVEELLDLRAAGRPDHQFALMVFYNDYLARCAIGVIRARGLRVPQDIGVAGYDDVEMPVAEDIALTTVHLPLEELGAEAVRRVQWRFANPSDPPLNWLLPTSVVDGNSVVDLRTRAVAKEAIHK